MTTVSTALRTYFEKLGLEHEIADIYLTLHAHGPQTISALSRNSGVERTRIYRLIDTLLESGLVELESHSTRGVVKAAPVANLRIFITKKEQELQSLHDELSMVEQLLARNSLSVPGLRVQAYYGQQGLRHMLHNELRTTAPIYTYGLDLSLYVAAYIGKKDWNEWQTALKKHKVRHIAVPQSPSSAPPNDQTTATCHIYGDVVAYYIPQNHEICGLELYSEPVAALQCSGLEQFRNNSAC